MIQIVTRPVNVSGSRWYRATYASCDERFGARAYGRTPEEAERKLRLEFPDDSAVVE